MTAALSERCLILAPRGRDADVAATILREAGIQSGICPTLGELVIGLDAGAGFAIVTEETVLTADLRGLSTWLMAQPEWSDFPFVLLTHRGDVERNPAAARYLETLGNVTFLERPFHPTTLISLSKAALRGRRRQYEARSRLEALRESGRRLGAALQAGRLGVHEFHPRSGRIEWDTRVREMWGVEADETITYDVFRNGIHADDLPRVEEAVAAALDPHGTGVYAVDYRVINRKDGMVHWISADGEVEFDAKGAVRMLGTVRDISDWKAAEAYLRESEARFRMLADSMPQLVWRTNAAGKVDYYNARHTLYEGLTVRSRDGWKWTTIVHPDDIDLTETAWNAALASGNPFSCEHRLETVDHQWRWHMSRAEAERDPEGRIVRWYGTATDIHDLKMAENDLRRLNETLELRVAEAIEERRVFGEIVESTDAFVDVLDTDYRWIAINNASANEFRRNFGIMPKIGDCILDLLRDWPTQAQLIEKLWARALGGEEFTEIAPIGGQGRYHESKFNVLRNAQGRRIGAYQFAYDVTQRLENEGRLRQAEDNLRQAQKMEAVGQLTGGVAHDFNNLLMVISGGLRMLEKGRSPDRRQLIMDSMNQAVARGAALTRQLLAFSRRKPLEDRPLNPERQLAGMRELLKRSLRADIEIRFVFDDGLWNIEVDPGEFELAILNLCVNARDAMTGAGVITIKASNRISDQRPPFGECVTVTVADNGCGMPPEVMARAFEPFYTTKDVGKGSGLGLAQVYAFASQSHGRVDIDSTVGLGTSISLTFPRSLKPVVEDELGSSQALPTPESSGSQQVLLVEDDKEVAAMVSEMLDSLGYSVTHVSSAASALGALANDRHLDLVFSDVMMAGGMNGLTLAREIRQRRPELPIVLATGYLEAARGAEADGFQILMKPYQIEKLATVLQAELQERRRH